MSQPLVVTIPHRLGREEAARRLKAGFSHARTNWSALMTMKEETWSGDQLAFRIGALGQEAAGTIDVGEDNVRIEVELPWLIARIADKIRPVLQRETQAMLEKK